MLAALMPPVAASPLDADPARFVWDDAARRLAAIEEADPVRLRAVAGNGRPTLIAFVDHRCYSCLRSVEPLEALIARFAGRANIVVIDPSRLTAAHGWAKDRYRVSFMPKFVLLDRKGAVAWEQTGRTSEEILATKLQALITR